MRIVIAHLRDEPSGHESIGAGQTLDEAIDDAVAHFHERSARAMYRRIARGDATVTRHDRTLYGAVR